jgi:anti-sigma regulatory factor (Ser/Thr protein kinase)
MTVRIASPYRPALSRTLRLEAALASVAVARREIAAAVGDWGVAVEADTAVLLTSELVANAVTHGAVTGEPVWLVIICFGDQLRVEVHDPVGCGIECGRSSLEGEPVFGESGRGLAIVEALADGWGWERTGWGKAVYFSLSSETGSLAA